ncbi:MAG: endonuclease [Acidobacteria bacterium]|nr:endonuclease [Acidobacteriota bacterium]
MEGPSIHLAAEQLQPFVGRRIGAVSGNSTIGIERLRGRRVADIFAWGKHLVFQLDTFALRVHFLLWGTFAATVRGASVTGDYRRTGPPRLVLAFPNGEITIWSASLRYLDLPRARDEYDFAVDVLSDAWDPAAALERARLYRASEIADVLLDQAIFAGVGNIIKNEVLFRTRTSPFARVGRLGAARLAAIVADARVFSFRFLELRRQFALRSHLEIYGRSVCPSCGGKVSRAVHGQRARRSFFCVRCQRVRRPPFGRSPSGQATAR